MCASELALQALSPEASPKDVEGALAICKASPGAGSSW